MDPSLTYSMGKQILKYVIRNLEEKPILGTEEDRQFMVSALEKTVIEPNVSPVLDPTVLRNYSFYYDGAINHSLRTGRIPKVIGKMLKEIETMIENAEIYQNLTLFRGTELEIPLNVGDQFSDKGFMSKTIDPIIAINFSKNSFFVLHYPGESQHLYIAPYSRFPVEKEFLTFPGEKFEVKVVLDYAETKYYLAEFIGYEDIPLDVIPFPQPPNLELVREYLLNDYVVIIQKDDKFSFNFTGERKMLEETEENYNYLPILLFSEEEPEDLERKIIGSFYSDDLLGVYLVEIPDYEFYDVKIKDGDLEVVKKEDIFSYVYYVLTKNYISAEGNLSVPKIKTIYEK